MFPMQLLFPQVFHLEVLNSKIQGSSCQGHLVRSSDSSIWFKFTWWCAFAIHPRRRLVLNSGHDESKKWFWLGVRFFARIVTVSLRSFGGTIYSRKDCTLVICGVRLGVSHLQRLPSQCGQCVYISRCPSSRVSARKKYTPESQNA